MGDWFKGGPYAGRTPTPYPRTELTEVTLDDVPVEWDTSNDAAFWAEEKAEFEAGMIADGFTKVGDASWYKVLTGGSTFTLTITGYETLGETDAQGPAQAGDHRPRVGEGDQ